MQFFRTILKYNTVTIYKSTNEYNRKKFSESGHKMDLYPAVVLIENRSCNSSVATTGDSHLVITIYHG